MEVKNMQYTFNCFGDDIRHLQKILNETSMVYEPEVHDWHDLLAVGRNLRGTLLGVTKNPKSLHAVACAMAWNSMERRWEVFGQKDLTKLYNISRGWQVAIEEHNNNLNISTFAIVEFVTRE